MKPNKMLVGALSLLMTVGTGVQALAEKGRLTLGHLPVTGHVGFFVAKEEGFFEKEGLDVKLVEFVNSADGVTALRTGKLDLGAFGTTAPLVNIANGAELTIVGGVMGEDAAVVAKREKASLFKDISGYKGKKVATVRLSTGDAVWRWALDQAGIDWKKDLQVYELKSPAAVIEAVKSGDADAGVIWGPHDLRAKDQGLSIVARTQDYFPKHPCCRLAVPTKGLADDRADLVKFLRALIQADRFVANNRKKTLEALVKYVKLDKDDLEKALYGGNLLVSPDPNTKGVIKFWKTLNKSEFITSSKNIAGHIDTSIYQEALKSVLAESPNDPYYKALLKEFGEDN